MRLRSISVLLTLLFLVGCGARDEKKSNEFDLTIGSRGHTSGLFNRPRGIRWDQEAELLHVVDWDGRVQSFTLDGRFRGSWIMPEVEIGKPEDLWVTKEGTILVTDTHYSRVMEFTRTGEEVRRWGSYGGGPGQFIYPVGICMDEDDFVYISEYGDSNRVQKFTRTGEFVASFGGFGSDFGEFQRPSGIAIGPDGNLYVSDAVNHRIQVLSRDGEFLRTIGKQGRKPGEFSYPYDVDFRNGKLLVLEFGNHRVQELEPDGTPLRMLGGPGNGDGEFASPWRFCVAEGRIYVSDTNNCRVVRLVF